MEMLSDAAHTVMAYRTPTTFALRHEILMAYRDVYGTHSQLEEAITLAIRFDAPGNFLEYLWNTYLTVKNRTNYINNFLLNSMDDAFEFHECKDGKDIMRFIWDKVLRSNISNGRINVTFVNRFVNDCAKAHFSFASIHWFLTYAQARLPFKIDILSLYKTAILAHNYPMTKDCYAFMDEGDKHIAVQSDFFHFSELVSDHYRLRCSTLELYDFMVFLVTTHGIKSINEFWWVAYAFTEGFDENEQRWIFLYNYRNNNFSVEFSDAEIKSVLDRIISCVYSDMDYEFIDFLNHFFSQSLQHLFGHNLFMNWLQRNLVDGGLSPFYATICVKILTKLQVDQQLINSFLN